MKRFWKQAEIIEQPGGWGVALDGVFVKTPARRDYVSPTRPLAEAVAAEWNAVQDKIETKSMPMTQFLATVLDVIPEKRTEIVQQLESYIETDCLYYYAESPPDLIVQQIESWRPYIDWAKQKFDIDLNTTVGVAPLRQDKRTVESLRRVIEGYDDFRLAALQNATTVTGSLILGLALLDRWRGANEIYAAAELDTDYQAARWGKDEETILRQKAIRAELVVTERFISLLEN